MKPEQFKQVVDQQMAKCTEIMVDRAKQYATDDRLHNFKVAGSLQGIDPKQALAGMMAKHTVSVYDMCLNRNNKQYPIELWDEKITDSINYLLLLKALVVEQDVPETTVYSDDKPYIVLTEKVN